MPSDPRAATLLNSASGNHVILLCYFLSKKSFYDLLLFSPRGCFKTQKKRSRPRPVHFFLWLGALGARHIFGFCNTSRARMLIFRMSDANVLLAFGFFTSSMHSELIEHVSSNSNGKPRAILILFSRTRFYNAMSLPSKPQQRFLFIHDLFDGAKMSFPH